MGFDSLRNVMMSDGHRFRLSLFSLSRELWRRRYTLCSDPSLDPRKSCRLSLGMDHSISSGLFVIFSNFLKNQPLLRRIQSPFLNVPLGTTSSRFSAPSA